MIDHTATTVFLAGTGRSGTTWVANVLNREGGYDYLFEPFHSRKVDLVRHFGYRQYLRPDDPRDSFLEPARRILTGRVRHPWIDAFGRAPKRRARLVKDIRANLMLKWVRVRFPEVTIILLLRHPCAIAHSKLKLGWDTHLDELLSQRELTADYLAPLEAELRAIDDPFEAHVAAWCIENAVPLRQFARGEIHAVFYEHLCTRPAQEFSKLFSALGQEFGDDALERSARPSPVTRRESRLRHGGSPVTGWLDEVGSAKIRRAVEILRLFGLETVYSDGPLPLVDAEDLFRAEA